jgi:hypothetical protein
MSTEVTAASLQVGPREIDQWLSRLDETNPAHRAIALDALEGLIKEYILPAMNLPLSQTRFDVFDLVVVKKGTCRTVTAALCPNRTSS